MRRCGLLLLGMLAVAACGSSNKGHPADASPDTPKPIDAMIDAGSAAATLTSFVIAMVETNNAAGPPAAFSTFATLPDPDGTNNNTTAYESLF
jgi:hypothetical protein